MKSEVVPTLQSDFMNNRVRLEASRDRGRRGQLASGLSVVKRREAALPELGWELSAQISVRGFS